MGVMDRFLNAMRLNSDDDDEYYDDDFYDEEEDEEDYDSSRKSRLRGRKSQDSDYDDDDYDFEETRSSAPKTFSQQSSNSKVTQLRTVKKASGSSMSVCVIKPISVEDSREITETLLAGRAVVLNLEGLDLEIAQRIIDFSSGSCYAIGGNLQKISNYIFIITPSNVDVSGDIQNLVSAFGGSAPGLRTDI